MSLISKIFGDANKKYLKKLYPLIEKINALEDNFEKTSREKLKEKTIELQTRVKNGEKTENVLPEAFALVREAAKRTINQRHFDVQLLGGIVLSRGGITEMKTGEGKTLVATLPLYLISLEKGGVHLVTVNDYLARRDAEWMGKIYHFLGVSVGVLNHEKSYLYEPKPGGRQTHLGSGEELKEVPRREAYLADITYGTNNEYGFDFLRDNMAYDKSEVVQREHSYAIVDEVDSILIDEARTPLIISAPAEESADLYSQLARVVEKLQLEKDYKIDEKMKAVTLTEEGQERLVELLHEDPWEMSASPDNLEKKGRGIELEHHITAALRAQALFKKDKDYVVRDGEIIIVDEFTGRLMLGRRYSEGLHQAIEAKETVEVKKESKTLATITFQNYFKMYKKLAGMTGTAETEAEEFYKIYNLDVTVIPTNKPMVRKDLSDRIYGTEVGKFKAVAREVKEKYKIGQPVLIGTTSIEKNEFLSKLLEKEGVPHEMLNAKNHEREAQILSQAGKFKAVTCATNMAGRGVDIILGGNPPDYRPDEEIQAYIREKEKGFIEKAEVFLKDDKGYTEWKEEHQKNLKKHGEEIEEIKQSAERIRHIYLAEETEENLTQNVEEIQQLEEKIRLSFKDYLDEYRSWGNEVEEKLKRKSEELEKAGKSNILQKIKEILGFKSEKVKLIKDVDEIIQRHQLFKKWQEEHNKILSLGGLHVIGTERHEARRIDNQLRGRAGRQGDSGSSQFFVSAEDDLMRIFGGVRIQSLMKTFNFPEDMPIENSLLSRSIEQAQKKVEGNNFDLRKHLLDYDNVLAKHREAIYRLRKEILEKEKPEEIQEKIFKMVEEEIENILVFHTTHDSEQNWDLAKVGETCASIFNLPGNWHKDFEKIREGAGNREQDIYARNNLFEYLFSLAKKTFKELEEKNEKNLFYRVTKFLILRTIDNFWIWHLEAMENLKGGIGLRAYGQRDPLVEYKKESYYKYHQLLDEIRKSIVHSVFKISIDAKKVETVERPKEVILSGPAKEGEAGAVEEHKEKVGRNDPCPCGSGKKYKKCCGR